jgi:hypothetical protein
MGADLVPGGVDVAYKSRVGVSDFTDNVERGVDPGCGEVIEECSRRRFHATRVFRLRLA